MSNSSFIGGTRLTAVFVAALFASSMFAAPPASAASCSVIAEQLWHQNDPLQDAKNRLTTCAKKYVKYPETLDSKSESQWESLCDKDKSYYTTQVPAARQRRLICSV